MQKVSFYPLPTTLLFIIQTEVERRRREDGVQQAMENGLSPCLYVLVCFSRISHDLEHLANPKWCHVVAP